MAKYKITYDRGNCIGAAACEAVAPDRWKLQDDNKVDLVGGTLNQETGKWELIVDDSEVNINVIKESADVCPVTVIIVEKIED